MAGIRRAGVGHGIEPARAERPASEQASERQPRPAGGAVDLEGFVGIARTGRIEATRRRPAGERSLVGLDPAQCPTLHGRRRHGPLLVRRAGGHVVDARRRSIVSNIDRSARSRSANVCSQARAFAPMRYSPGGTSDVANNARSRRRSRLRRTAVPTARPMAKATCGGIRSGSRTYEHHSGSARTRAPSRLMRTKASRSRTRSIKPTGERGPWRDGTSAPRGRHGCSSGHGTRASWLGGGCWAGRYASRLTPDDSMHTSQQASAATGARPTD